MKSLFKRTLAAATGSVMALSQLAATAATSVNAASEGDTLVVNKAYALAVPFDEANPLVGLVPGSAGLDIDIDPALPAITRSGKLEIADASLVKHSDLADKLETAILATLKDAGSIKATVETKSIKESAAEALARPQIAQYISKENAATLINAIGNAEAAVYADNTFEATISINEVGPVVGDIVETEMRKRIDLSFADEESGVPIDWSNTSIKGSLSINGELDFAGRIVSYTISFIDENNKAVALTDYVAAKAAELCDVMLETCQANIDKMIADNAEESKIDNAKNTYSKAVAKKAALLQKLADVIDLAESIKDIKVAGKAANIKELNSIYQSYTDALAEKIANSNVVGKNKGLKLLDEKFPETVEAIFGDNILTRNGAKIKNILNDSATSFGIDAKIELGVADLAEVMYSGYDWKVDISGYSFEAAFSLPDEENEVAALIEAIQNKYQRVVTSIETHKEAYVSYAGEAYGLGGNASFDVYRLIDSIELGEEITTTSTTETTESTSETTDTESTTEATETSKTTESTTEATETSKTTESTTEATETSKTTESTTEATETSKTTESTTEATETSKTTESTTEVTETSKTTASTTEATETSKTTASTTEATETSKTTASTTEATETSKTTASTTEATETSKTTASTTEATETSKTTASTTEATETSKTTESTTEATETSKTTASTTEATETSKTTESTTEATETSKTTESTTEATETSKTTASTTEATETSKTTESTTEATETTESTESTTETTETTDSTESTTETTETTESTTETTETTSETTTTDETSTTPAKYIAFELNDAYKDGLVYWSEEDTPFDLSKLAISLKVYENGEVTKTVPLPLSAFAPSATKASDIDFPVGSYLVNGVCQFTLEDVEAIKAIMEAEGIEVSSVDIKGQLALEKGASAGSFAVILVLRGDANLDGKLDLDDVNDTLFYYNFTFLLNLTAEDVLESGYVLMSHADNIADMFKYAHYAMDVTGDGVIVFEDLSGAVFYYSLNYLLGLGEEWDSESIINAETVPEAVLHLDPLANDEYASAE